MLKVNFKKWQQTPQDLRDKALCADHPRTRERFLALYEISQGKIATQVANEIKRLPWTVMEWVHKYNNEGENALIYQRSGGKRPLFL
jgi:transposase